jgi:hypothetical protein
MALQLMGFTDQARKQIADLVAESLDSGYHFDIYMGYLYFGLIHLANRDFDACQAEMKRYLVLGNEYGDPFPVMITTIVHNLSLTDKEDEDAFRSSKAAIDMLRAAGYGLGISLLTGQYASGLIEYGDLEGAQKALDETFEHLDAVGNELWEAEIHRLQGLVWQLTGEPASRVEEAYVRAIQIANRQGTALFELRATTSLSRLLASEERQEEASDLLSRILENVDEGFDATAVREATALLHDLTSA